MAIDYELNLDGKVVDHPEDVDSLISLLINVKHSWIISDKEADHHFIQGVVGSEDGGNGFTDIEHWFDEERLGSATYADIPQAYEILTLFLEDADFQRRHREEVGGDTFCTSCGSKLTPGQRFCPSCGEKKS